MSFGTRAKVHFRLAVNCAPARAKIGASPPFSHSWGAKSPRAKIYYILHLVIKYTILVVCLIEVVKLDMKSIYQS